MTKAVPVLILLVLSIWGCGAPGERSIASMTVRKSTFEIVIPGFGELQAVTSTPILVPSQLRRSQTLAWIAPENSYVKKGETVIRLDGNWYNEQIQQEEFNISKLDLEIRKKEKELAKQKNDLRGQLNITTIEKEMAELYGAKDETIYPRNKIIEDAVNLDYLKVKTRHFNRKKVKLEEKARAELQLLQLKRRTHQVKVDQYKSALKSLQIKAPHDGLFVYRRNWRGEEPRIGMAVWRGYKLGELPDLSKMEAKIHVLESEAGGLKEKLRVSVVMDSLPTEVYPGKVATVDKMAKPLDQESPLKYFEVKVNLDRTNPEIMKPGNQVKAFIFVEKQEEVIAVPNQALFFDDGKVYIHIKNGSTVEKREVEIGARSLTRTVVTRGVGEGEVILLGNPKKEEGG